MTLIAVPVSLVDPAEAGRAMHRAESAAASGADLIEWRFDALADDDDARPLIRRLIEASPKPAIVTVRATEEGGVYDGTDAARADFTAFLARLDRPPRYVDWELSTLERSAALRTAVADLIASGEHAPGLIVSIHDFSGRPSDLSARLVRAHAYPGAAVVKVAWRARSVRDALEAFELLVHRSRPMIALCMGEAGLASRVLAPKFGALLSFASSTDAQASAPGQPTLDQLLKQYRFRSINTDTALYGVVGWPTAQSKGPLLHNDAFRRAHLNAVYLPIPVSPEYESLKASLATLLDMEIAGRSAANLRGLSVTIPHKESLLQFGRERAAVVDDAAERIGAANTLTVEPDGSLHISNTDAPAIAGILAEAIGAIEPEKQVVRIIGSGGAARAAAWAGLSLGLDVELCARNHEAADAIVRTLCEMPKARISQRIDHDTRDDRQLVLINATPLGMHLGPAPDALPTDPQLLRSGDIVFDTVYTPPNTPLLCAAKEAGARCIDGRQLFLRQAALQFTLWTNASPPEGAYTALPDDG